MRSDWTPDAKYLFFDAGPYGGPHGHEDKLSIEIYVFGHPFLVDVGSYTYDDSSPFRRYFKGTYGHNTILVDGLSQIRGWYGDYMEPRVGVKPDAVWVNRPEFDYAVATYGDGYGEFSIRRPDAAVIIDDVIHTRHVLFIKPDYWILVDELQATECHRYQQLFHADPNVILAHVENNKVFLGIESGAAQLVLVPSASETKVRLLSGCEEPVQGWYSPEADVKQPSTVVIYETEKLSSTVLSTLVFPSLEHVSGTGVAMDISIESIAISGGAGLAFEVQTPQGKDYLMLSSNTERKQFGPYEASSKLAVVRTDKKGNVLSQFEW